MYCFKILFLERGREEREGEKHQCVVASHVPPIGDLACNPSMCPDWESSWQPFGSQPALSPLSHTVQGPCEVSLMIRVRPPSQHLVRVPGRGTLVVCKTTLPLGHRCPIFQEAFPEPPSACTLYFLCDSTYYPLLGFDHLFPCLSLIIL